MVDLEETDIEETSAITTPALDENIVPLPVVSGVVHLLGHAY